MSRAQRCLLGAAAALALALVVAACGSGSGSGEITIPPGAPPQEVFEAAGMHGVHSGEAEASLIVAKLKKNEAISFRVNGSFKRLNEGSAPHLFIAASSQGQWNRRSVDFNSSLTVLPNKAAIAYGHAVGEKSYEVTASSFDKLRSKLEQAHSEGGEGDLTACLQAAEGFDFAQLVRDPKIEDRREESDGTKVIVVAGDLIIARLRSLLVKLARDPGCAAQMEALGLPPAAQLEAARVDFKKGFGGPHLTLAVDRHGVIRELSTRFECARLNGEFFELQLDFNLRKVNGAIEVNDAAEGEPVANLLRKLGTTEEAALQAQSSEAVVALLKGLSGALTGRRQ